MNSNGGPLDVLLRLFLSVEGLFLIVAAAVTLLLAVAWRPAKWALLVPLLFLNSVGRSTGTPWFDLRMIPVLQQYTNNSRPVLTGLLLALAIPAIMSPRGWRTRIVLPAAAAYFVFQLTVVARTAIEGDLPRAAFSLLIYCLVFLVLSVGLSRWMQDVVTVRVAIASVVAAGALFILSSLVQYAVYPSAAVMQSRFNGVAINPNYSGLILAGTLPAACYFLIDKSTGALGRVACSIVAGITVVLILWSGSRNAGLMMCVGCVVLFRFRLGKFFIAAMACGIVIAIGLQLLGDTPIGERMLSRADTRTDAWKSMFTNFLASPFIGKAGGLGSENSYLLAASSFGLLGLIPLLSAMALIAMQLLDLHRRRALLGDQVLILDLATAGIATYAVGALFDGFLVAVFSTALYILLIYVAILAYLSDVAAYSAAHLGQNATPYDEYPAEMSQSPVWN